MTGAGKWGDLGPRIVSGVVLAAVGLGAIWAGGWWFAALALVAGTLMIWELALMLDPARPRDATLLAGLAALGLGASLGGASAAAFLPLAAPAVAALVMPRRGKLIFVLYGTAVLVAAAGLVVFRAEHGMLWLGWLIAVVVVTDIAGYFAGRLIGGPKFWPRVSPKKTWSGTVAGWAAAAGVGFVFLEFTTAGPDLPWISAALAFASQMGDAAESAVKRHAGVKDSSGLIPGHGGLLDRFDGVLGAALFMLLVAQVVVVPVVRG